MLFTKYFMIIIYGCMVTAGTVNTESQVHAFRFLAISAALAALCITSGHFSRLTILFPSKNPSFLGKPWDPSENVTRPETESGFRCVDQMINFHYTYQQNNTVRKIAKMEQVIIYSL